jgi:hypothetical protein
MFSDSVIYKGGLFVIYIIKHLCLSEWEIKETCQFKLAQINANVFSLEHL